MTTTDQAAEQVASMPDEFGNPQPMASWERESLERVRQATARTADHWELVDGEWVRQSVDAPGNFIEVPEPKGESDYICGWCQQVVSWSHRFVDQFSDNTPYHKVCWENRQAGINIAQAMNGERCSAPCNC